MRVVKTEGIIIKRKNIGEADKLLTVLTSNRGKIYIKAPGVRKISSRRSSHIELLNRASLSLYIRTSYPILTEAQMISDFFEMKQDLDKVGYAYHMCEIVDGLCAENEDNEAVYALLVATLETICVSQNASFHVRAFELRLLELLGFGTPSMRTREFFNPQAYIESLLEKKLKSKDIFLQK